MRASPDDARMTRDRLIERIAALAILRGDFTLRSGRKSTYYVDKYRFSTQPDVLSELGKLFAQHLTPQTTRIAGAELGAVSLAASASIASGKPFVIVRNQKKDYGTSKLVEGILEKGDSVLLVEDILPTGGQVLEAARTLTEAGATVERIVGVIDRLEGARQNIEAAGYQMESLFTITDLGIDGPH